jgi:hypothetical protein
LVSRATLKLGAGKLQKRPRQIFLLWLGSKKSLKSIELQNSKNSRHTNIKEKK